MLLDPPVRLDLQGQQEQAQQELQERLVQAVQADRRVLVLRVQLAQVVRVDLRELNIPGKVLGLLIQFIQPMIV